MAIGLVAVLLVVFFVLWLVTMAVPAPAWLHQFFFVMTMLCLVLLALGVEWMLG